MGKAGQESTARSSATSLPLAVLVAVALGSPWAFGSVDPLPRFLVVLVASSACALAAAWSAARGGVPLPGVPLWPLMALLALGALQLVPLPPPLLRLVSPGSAVVWYPDVGAARAVLGGGWRPISLDPAAAVQGLLLALGLVGLGLLAVGALVRHGPARRAAAALVLGAAALAIYGILARSRFGPLLYGRITVPTVSPFGPFVSKNHFAGYVGPAALLTLGLCLGLAGRARGTDWTRDRSAAGVVLALVAAVAMAIALFVSHSRGGALAALSGGLAFGALVYTTRRGARTLAPAAVVALVLVGLMDLALPDETRTRVTTLEGSSFRLDTWRDGLRLSARSPIFGHGFAAFADAYPRLKRGHGTIRVEHAENEYVELLVEGGLVALGLALLAFLLPARRVVDALARGDPLRSGLAIGALSGLVALAAHSLVDFNLRLPSNAALAALLAAFAAAGAGLRARELARLPLAVAALVFAAAAAAAAWLGPRGFDRDARWRQVRREVREAVAAPAAEVRDLRVQRATPLLEETLRLRPAFAEGWLVLAALRKAVGETAEAGRLAGYACSLDPSRSEIQEAARSLGHD
jgi:O-antigen ligase